MAEFSLDAVRKSLEARTRTLQEIETEQAPLNDLFAKQQQYRSMEREATAEVERAVRDVDVIALDAARVSLRQAQDGQSMCAARIKGIENGVSHKRVIVRDAENNIAHHFLSAAIERGRCLETGDLSQQERQLEIDLENLRRVKTERLREAEAVGSLVFDLGPEGKEILSRDRRIEPYIAFAEGRATFRD